MGFWSRLARTLRADRRDRHEDEIDEEIQFHLAMKARDGTSARETRLRFGPRDAIRVETRAAGVVQWLDSLLQDTRYGLRQLRQTPAVTLAIVLSLGIGIGANTAIFELVDAALIEGLPVPDPGSLVVVQWKAESWPKKLATGHTGTTDDDPAGHIFAASSFGPKLYRRLAQDQTVATALIGFTDGEGVGIVPKGGTAAQARLQWVSDNFFQGLQVTPILGRAFLPEDDRPGSEPVVIISHRIWQQQFGSRQVIDEPVRINGNLARIIGVAPAGFFGNQIGAWTDVYATLAARTVLGSGLGRANRVDVIEMDGYWWVRTMARLKPGSDPAAVRDRLALLFRRLVVPEGLSVQANELPDLLLQPGNRGFDAVSGDQARPLLILLLLVTLVLLIVCANVANLLLSRAVARQREAAVRLALGAGRWRLLRQQLVESVVLALIGGAAGLGLGLLLVQALVSVGAAGRGLDLHLNARMIAYSGGISILTALIFGCAPALRMARADVNAALKTSSRSVLAGRLRLPRTLVIAQIALCLTVLVAASLLGRSLAHLKGQDIGFERDHIVYVSTNPFRAGYHQNQVGPYADRLHEALAAVPGVKRAGFIMQPPLNGGTTITSVRPIGQPPPGVPPSMDVQVHFCSDGLIETLGISLLAGRTLEPRDLLPGANTMVVDERFARKMFPGEIAVGRRVNLGRDTGDNQREIVGVVSMSRYDSLRREPLPMIYQPWQPGQSRGADIIVAVRTSVDPRGLFDAFRHAATSIDPAVAIDRIATQTSLIDNLLRTERLLSVLSNGFGLVALILAGVGLAGLLIYSVTRRTNEIGVRIALGAAPTQVAQMVLRDSLRLLAVGILVGLPCAYGVARLLRGTLFDLKPADPTSAALALTVLAAVAALAAWLPARRAARIDPIAALRDE